LLFHIHHVIIVIKHAINGLCYGPLRSFAVFSQTFVVGVESVFGGLFSFISLFVKLKWTWADHDWSEN